MKKLITLLLALALICLPFSGLAEEADNQIYTDTIPFQNRTSVSGQRFTLEVGYVSDSGWRVGTSVFTHESTLTIMPQEAYQGALEIISVQLTVSKGSEYYVNIEASSGTKKPNTVSKDGTTVQVNGVNSDSLTMSGSWGNVFFKDAIVRYRCKHIFTDSKCQVCGYECQHDFDAEHKCRVCGMTECQLAGSHDFVDGVCQVCGYNCPCRDGNCPECGRAVSSASVPPTGFALSQGSVTVVVGVACLALGFLGAALVFRKRKAG